MGTLSSEFPNVEAVEQALKDGKLSVNRLNEVYNNLSSKADQTVIDDLQTQIDNLVLEASESGDVSHEVAQARGAYSTLNERLDVENNKNNGYSKAISTDSFSVFNSGYAGFEMPMVSLGMIDPQTGEILPRLNRAYSERVNINDVKAYLNISLSDYIVFKIGVACFNANGEHIGNVGYFTTDVPSTELLNNTASISLVYARNDDANLSSSDLEWLNANTFIKYGKLIYDKDIKAHYSNTLSGNAYDKYAILGFSSTNRASVVLNPTGNINNLGIIFKDSRCFGPISDFSLNLTNCSGNENKLIYLNPDSKTFYVCDGVDPAPYKTIANECVLIGFVCITVPIISNTCLQMSVDDVNVMPYYGEYKSKIEDLEKKSNIFSEFHYTIGTDGNNCIDAVPLLEFTASNKASVTLSSKINRLSVCVGGSTYGINLSELALDTSGLSTGDNKLVYLDFVNRILYVFDGTNPSSNAAKSSGFLFLGLVCIPVPEVSICKLQMSIDGRNLMMSGGAELANVRYQNKSFSVIGDSISRYDESWGGQPASTTGWGGNTYKSAGYSANDMWWHRLAIATGMAINTINANAGSCCSNGNPSRIPGCSDQRTSALDNGTNPDFIICEMGTNDFLYGVDLGSYDGTTDVPSDISTFIGAYANMLKKIQNNYPMAKIFCCTIHQHTHESYITLSRNLPVIVNRDEITLRDYNNAIREIAKLFGCGIIDFESSGINIRNAADLTFDDSTTMHLHPTDVGQRLLADRAIAVFR